MIFSYLLNMQSHPSWVCGLKHADGGIERTEEGVTSFVGVWIETYQMDRLNAANRSHPSWVCGLKLICCSRLANACCHILRGCVD